MSDPKTTYFVNHEDMTELAGAIWKKKLEYERFLQESGLYALYRKMHSYYYGMDEKGYSTHEIKRVNNTSGDVMARVNHLRSIFTSWLNLAMTQRAAMQPIALVRDYESDIEVKRGKAVLDKYSHERQEADAVEWSGLYGHAWLEQDWNPFIGELVMPAALPELPELMLPAGEPVQAELAGGSGPSPRVSEPPGQGAPPAPGATALPVENAGYSVFSGDLECRALSPLDTFFDPRRKDTEHNWLGTTRWVNKFDLAAQYADQPELQQRIIDSEPNRVDEGIALDFGVWGAQAGRDNSDEVPVYVLWHKRTPAVPDGKRIVMLGDKLILENGPLGKYRDIPVRRVAPANIARTPFGYSDAWDLMVPQEAADVLRSIAVTNAKTFGSGLMATPKGGDITAEHVTDGLVLIEYTPNGLGPDGGMPKPVQMPSTPQEVYMLRKEMIQDAGTLIGVNSVIRGDPEASLKSGSALALVQAQGVQFSGKFQDAIKRFQEKRAMDTIEIVRDFMTDERQFELVGEHTASLLLPFTGSGLKRIGKIKVQGMNPLAKTLAGRVQIGDTLMERFAGLLQPGDYFRLLETGELRHLTDPLAQREANIEQENELLAKGIGPVPMVPMGPPDPMTGMPSPVAAREPGKTYVRALITDDHRAHVRKHLEVLDNPAIRDAQPGMPGAEVVQAVLDHVEEHEQMLLLATTQRMTLLELTQQLPLQSAMMMGPMGAPGPGAPPNGPDGSGGGAPLGSGGPPQPKLSANKGDPSGSLQQVPPQGNGAPRMPLMPRNPATGERVQPPPPR